MTLQANVKVFGNFLIKALNKEINFSSDDIKLMLFTSAYTPDQDLHIYKSSVTNEVVGTGYTAGGVSLANKTITYDSATNKIIIDADDISLLNTTLTARGFVIYDNTPATDAVKPLIAYGIFEDSVTPGVPIDAVTTGGTFAVTFDAAGIFTITAA